MEITQPYMHIHAACYGTSKFVFVYFYDDDNDDEEDMVVGGNVKYTK